MNIQVEPRTIRERTLIKIPEADSPTCKNLYMDPSSQRSRGWNLVFCKEVLLVSLWNIIVSGDLSFSWGEEGLSCWEDDAGSKQLVVILFAILDINKDIQVFLHILVCLMIYAFMWSIYLWSYIVYDSRSLFLDSVMLLWFHRCSLKLGRRMRSGEDLSEGRGTKQGTKHKTEVGVLPSPLIYFS